MRKRMWILLLALALAATAGVASIAALANYEAGAAARVSEDALKKGGYTLAEYNGVIGVYEGDRLLMTADVPLESLREVDREQIVRGIAVDTWEQAVRLLEDFGA